VEILSRLQSGTLFEHFPKLAIGGSRIGGGFQHHQGSFLQVRRDGLPGFDNVGDIRFSVLVQRCRHANQHRINLFDSGEIAGRGESTGSTLLLDCHRLDMSDVTSARVARIDLRLVNIEPKHVHFRTGELQT
jgi:hypothetical protein